MTHSNKTFQGGSRGTLTDSDSWLVATTPGDSNSDSAPLASAVWCHSLICSFFSVGYHSRFILRDFYIIFLFCLFRCLCEPRTSFQICQLNTRLWLLASTGPSGCDQPASGPRCFSCSQGHRDGNLGRDEKSASRC